MPEEGENPQGSRPVPDPTFLTTEALHREITGLRELLEAKVKSLADLLAERVERVNERVTLLDNQRASEKQNADQALQVALVSIKEQLAQMMAANQTAVESLRRETGDLKDRVGRVEFGPSPPG